MERISAPVRQGAGFSRVSDVDENKKFPEKHGPSSLCSLPIWNASSTHLPLFSIILPGPFPSPEINLNVSWTHLYCWVAFPSLTRSIWPLLFAWSSSAWVPSFTSKILNFMNNFLRIRSIRMRRSPPREAVGSLSLLECRIWARQSNSGRRPRNNPSAGLS